MAVSPPLASFDPLIAQWFAQRFSAATEPQVQGWPLIREGRDVLISAPTGSGKTLAAFLICLDGLVRQARAGSLEARTEVLYVSPLKALSNDIHKNLEVPLAEICGHADLSPIIAAVRTGDTPQWERQRMLGKPPHVLVTTPESFFILVTTERGRRMLSTVRTVIVDEIHAVAGDKRGSHLALSLARLDALIESNGLRRPQRIGLSATVKPLEEVARFLGEETVTVQVGHRRAMELAVEVPRDELGPVASTEMWGEIYDRLAELIRENRTTLVFVNTRRLAERVAHHLGERLGVDAVLPHHGSLSRKLRLNAEERLKKGELRAVVATASLELGIDIGTVDLVCQIGTPRSIAVALQRVGRSGHWVGAMPKGRFFATTRDDLIENAALVRAIRAGELDRIHVPRAPLDVLAQQIVAAAACDDWSEDALFEMARGCYSYAALQRHDFDAVIEMLSDGIATARGRSGAYLHRDQVNGRVKGRRGARLAAVTGGGAIPDNANYQVVAEPEGVVVGTVDEDFAVEATVGDIFLLGTTSWKIRRVESGRVRVDHAPGSTPSIPFWNGEAPGRTLELSREVSKLREAICNAGAPPAGADLLIAECGLDRRGAEQAAEYVIAGRDALGALPTCETVVAERFFDEAGGMQLILHAPFGARITRAWGLALRKRFCRNFNFELQAAATDNGLVISLSEQHAFPLEVIYQFLKPETLEHTLSQALLASPMFQARWRWNASRALAVLRFSGGRKTPPPIQRMRSDDLLASVFPDQAACPENLIGEPKIPDHPLVNETISNCLHEAMDLESLREIVRKVQNGEIRAVAIDTAEASPFSHEILNSNPYAYLDDAPLEERRARAVELRKTLPSGAVAGDVGQLDAAAIDEVREQAWPAVRDADELHDALLTLGVLPPVAEWVEYFHTLSANRRATTLHANGAAFWVAAERLDLARGLYREAEISPHIPTCAGKDARATASQEECATAVMRGWLELSGPVRASEMAARLALPAWLTESALLRLEGSGEILRGRFTPGLRQEDEIEWCNRRLLARIHRLTLGRLRREIEPVTSAQFVRFLCRWQHVLSGTRLHGVEGLFAIVRQLQGYEISAAAWESEILPRRMVGYKPEYLDRLCLSGEVAWGRLTPRSFDAGAGGESPVARRVRPTRVAPLSIFLREDSVWLLPPRDGQLPLLSHQAQAVLAELQRRGASFFGELQRGSGRLPSEVEDALWELVAAGLVTADGFENLRALVDTKRRRGEGRGRSARPRHAAGRWSLLTADHEEPSVANFARQLLRRWGVLFRDLLARETLAPPWRDLLVELRRMEARGEIRGGRFVSGPVGEQYALPEAVDLLRAVRRESTSEVQEISAADPLNLCGIVLPGARISALSGGTLRLRDGVTDLPVPA
jgi:ATP-dependent helicase Lhr and Lhr-like helicase